MPQSEKEGALAWSHGFGVRLGGVASIDDLRVGAAWWTKIPVGWHLRTARGRPMPTDRGLYRPGFGVWAHDGNARRSWLLAPGKSLKTVGSYRTLRQLRLRMRRPCAAGTRSAWGAHTERSGRPSRSRRREYRNAPQRSTWKLTPQLKQWLLESPQTGVEAAHALGITQGRANGD